MKKILVSIYKEATLLLRDIEGVTVMFIMPLILVVVVALLQHKTFQSIAEDKIPVVIVDFDNDVLGKTLIDGIAASNMFTITKVEVSDSAALKQAKADVSAGKYQIGIFIPDSTTETIKARGIAMVQQQIPGAIQSKLSDMNKQSTIQLFFDPIIKQSFRDLMKSTLMQFSAKVETQILFDAYAKFIDALTNQTTEIKYPDRPALTFSESLESKYSGGVIPNAVQHNVPAWILFGMFLICIPVAGNIIKERDEGCMARLKTVPVSFLQIMVGKVFVFVAICVIQAILMILVGMFVMPLLNLPALQINHNWLAVFVVSLASGFAASGYGIAIGGLASTHIQASAFGAVSTVIMAAIGGAWVPVLIMPAVMQKISAFSPMNWGIHAYYEVFLRGANVLQILPDVGKLFLFSAIGIAVATIAKKYHKSM